MNLFNTENGIQSFGGVIHTDKKGDLLTFEDWNHSSLTSNVPIGINLRMMRMMEKFLDLPTLSTTAKRNRHGKNI